MSPSPLTVISRLARPPSVGDGFDSPLWSSAAPITINSWHARSTEHHPLVRLRLGHTGSRLHFSWSVDDCFVASRNTQVNGNVCRDSCVEAFLAPRPGLGYFNLEINAGGTIHLSYVRDHRKVEGKSGFADFCFVDPALIAKHISVVGSLPGVVDPEITVPCHWTMAVNVDLAIYAHYLGEPINADGLWSGNFYKCADQTSKPHWGSWNPVGDVLNFHKPECFAPIGFQA